MTDLSRPRSFACGTESVGVLQIHLMKYIAAKTGSHTLQQNKIDKISHVLEFFYLQISHHALINVETMGSDNSRVPQIMCSHI